MGSLPLTSASISSCRARGLLGDVRGHGGQRLLDRDGHGEQQRLVELVDAFHADPGHGEHHRERGDPAGDPVTEVLQPPLEGRAFDLDDVRRKLDPIGSEGANGDATEPRLAARSTTETDPHVSGTIRVQSLEGRGRDRD